MSTDTYHLHLVRDGGEVEMDASEEVVHTEFSKPDTLYVWTRTTTGNSMESLPDELKNDNNLEI